MTRVFGIAAGVFVFHLASATVYGYHRDEFYYLAQGRRLAWGYVDNPPLTPFLYRLDSNLFGTSRLGLSVMPALLHAVLVVLTALIAREFGGNTRAELLCAIGAAFAPIFVTTGHFLGTVTPECVAGAALALFVARVIRTDDPRWWLAVGLVLGLGLLDHWTLGFYAVGLFVGLVFTPQRTLLWSPWTLAAALVTAAIVAPNVAWQARHGWTQVEFAKHLRNYAVTPRVIPAQFVILGAASLLLAVPGILWLLRDNSGRPYRALAIAFFVTLGLVLITGGKEYYTVAALPALLAAGGVVYMHTTSWTVLAVLTGVGLVLLPLATPLLPLSTANVVRTLNPEIGEMVGWSNVVETVRPIALANPNAPIVTSNYSEAGAIELLGKPKGMHQPYSGHLTYWYWARPPGRSDSVIFVGYERSFLERFFTVVRQATTIHTPGGVANMEDGTPIWIASGQRADWAEIWPDFKHQ